LHFLTGELESVSRYQSPIFREKANGKASFSTNEFIAEDREELSDFQKIVF